MTKLEKSQSMKVETDFNGNKLDYVIDAKHEHWLHRMLRELEFEYDK